MGIATISAKTKEGKAGGSEDRKLMINTSFIPPPRIMFAEPGNKPSSKDWKDLKESFARFITLNRDLGGTHFEQKTEMLLFESFLGREGIRFLKTLGVEEQNGVLEIQAALDIH